MAAVRTLADKIQPHLLVTELRAIKADDLWLSETQARASLAIHFTFAKHPAEVALLLPQIEGVLAPFTQRPDWGNVSSGTANELEGRYPRLHEFRELVDKHDPEDKFGGRFVDDILLRR